MTEPTRKHPAINELLSSIAGKDREETIRNGHCMTCNFTARLFRDLQSQREYAISGMCQTCQDRTFGRPRR